MNEHSLFLPETSFALRTSIEVVRTYPVKHLPATGVVGPRLSGVAVTVTV